MVMPITCAGFPARKRRCERDRGYLENAVQPARHFIFAINKTAHAVQVGMHLMGVQG